MSRKYIIIILVIIAVFAVLIYRYSYRSEFSATDNLVSPPASTSPQSSGSSTSTSNIDANLSYTKAVAKYINTRIQFDASCQGSPKAVVFKNNTNVMFDNRSGDARWFSLDGHAYHLNGYGFVVLTLNSTKLPHPIVVDCGSAKNVMQITLEK